MKILIAYASTEGQTRKIARYAADRLVDHGHFVELLPLSEAEEVNPDRFDGAILAASLHAGHYQRALTTFVTDHTDWLSRHSALFLSVSLAAAGHDAEDWRGLDRVLDDFKEATGWTPAQVHQVAGAYRPDRYDIFRRFIMRRIIAEKDPAADLDQTREYTDWADLDTVLDNWMGSLGT
jgi:menaquinone-dependent protoporphyrinogen oxidase